MPAVTILRDNMPDLKIRFINVVDLFKLQSNTQHPHGLSDTDYDALFTKDKPIIFAFHGYPTLIHELTYYRHNRNLQVFGYHLLQAVINALPQLGNKGSYLLQKMRDTLVAHKQYISEYGMDLPEVQEWKWHTPDNK